MFQLRFETDNAAFEGDLRSEEVARILRHLADRVDDMRDAGNVVDINGNTIGAWKLEAQP